MTEKSNRDTNQILNIVNSPIKLLALIVLIIESILGIVAYNCDGLDRTIIIIGMIVSLIFVIAVVSKFANKENSADQEYDSWFGNAGKIYDVFISTPMSSFSTDEKYKEHHAEILEFKEFIRRDTNFGEEIYFSGEHIKSQKEFEPPDISLTSDLAALKSSKLFVLIYLEDLNSSVIVESGFALAMEKPSLFFVKSRKHLPYMLREIGQVKKANVRIYEVNDFNDLKAKLKKDGKKILESLLPMNTG